MNHRNTLAPRPDRTEIFRIGMARPKPVASGIGATLTGFLALATLAAVAASAARAEDIGSDLKATIALQGLPCDQIIGSKRNADSDYAVTCKDGNRYHVYVNAQGRVVVEKQ